MALPVDSAPQMVGIVEVDVGEPLRFGCPLCELKGARLAVPFWANRRPALIRMS